MANEMTGQNQESAASSVPHQLSWPKRCLALLVYGFIRFVSWTLRWELNNQSGLLRKGEEPEPVIFCIWHNRLALSLVLYLKFAKKPQPSRRMAAIVSASEDGAGMARILELFHVQPVRGSTNRRGTQALRELTIWAARGFDLSITPDGPRGPCYVIQPGVIMLAKLTGMPIMPVTYYLSWKIRPRSWDRFQIPLPFARCRVELGVPLRVPPDSSDEERETLRRELEGRLRALTRD